MARDPFNDPSHVEPIEGVVSLRGPGAMSASLTPSAARETAKRLHAAAGRADQGHVEIIDLEDGAGVQRWAARLCVEPDAIRAAIVQVGPNSELVANYLADKS